MTRMFKSLSALLVLLGVLMAVPVLLVALWKVPGFVPSWFQLRSSLLGPDDGQVFLLVIWAAAWLIWLYLTSLIISETFSFVRSVQLTPSSLAIPQGGIRASLPRGLARQLVVSAAVLFVALPSAPAHADDSHVQEAVPEAPITSTTRGSSAGAPSQVAEPTDAPPAERLGVAVVVQRGDTLWDLAATHLGDPLRWPEIFETNHGITQPDGHALLDPDLIDIGWTLTIPQDTQASTSPPPEPPQTAPPPDQDQTPPPPDPREPGPGSGGDVSTREGVDDRPRATPMMPPSGVEFVPTTADTIEVEEAHDEVPHNDEAEGEWPWAVSGLLGTGMFLGVGVSWLLGQRRREQFRQRRPGQVIADAPRVVQPVERTARAADGMSSRLLKRVDAVLRRVATADQVPVVEAVGVARDGTITLKTTTALPEPWQQQPQGQGWILDGGIAPEHIGADVSEHRSAPYPLLVTIGADAGSAVWLLNLEHCGRLGITGDEVMVADFLRYIAAELAVNPWSDIRAACGGNSAAVVPMAPERLDATIPEIQQIAEINFDRATRTGVNASQGRLTQAGDEAWAAGIILDSSQDAADLENLIASHPHQTGVAVVAIDDDGELELTSTGRLEGLGLDLVAVGLTEDEAAGCAVLLASAAVDDSIDPNPADDLTDTLGNVLPQHRVPRDDPEEPGSESLLPAPAHEYVERAVVVEEELHILAPRVAEPVASELNQRDPMLDDHVKLWFAENCHLPRLTLLGPVQARCYGQPLAKQKAYYTEALAYLALHPQGVTSDQFAEAFNIKPDRARTVISQLRAWVGTNPATNTLHIPDAKTTKPAQATGVALYVVEDLLLDVDLFRRLRARAHARGPAGIADLQTALRLVTGSPFDQLRNGGWKWLIEGDRIDQHMVCAISDVAHIVTTHHLHSGDMDAAHAAATIGLQADPDSETARMNLAGIMIHQGHSKPARDIVADALGPTAELDATQRTNEILSRKGWSKIS